MTTTRFSKTRFSTTRFLLCIGLSLWPAQTAVAQSYVDTSNMTLVGDWQFNGDASDSSGNGAHGIAHGVDFSSGTFARFSGPSGSPDSAGRYQGSYIEIPNAEPLRPAMGSAGAEELLMVARVRMRPIAPMPGVNNPAFYQTLFSTPEVALSAHNLGTPHVRPVWVLSQKSTTVSYPSCSDRRWGCGPNLWAAPHDTGEFSYWGWRGTGGRFIDHDVWVEVAVHFDAAASRVVHYVDGLPIETYDLTDDLPMMRREWSPLHGFYGLIGGTVQFSEFTRYVFKGDIDYLKVYSRWASNCEVDDFEDGDTAGWAAAGIGHANQMTVALIDDGGNRELSLSSDGATAYYGADNGGFVYREMSGDFRIETTVDTTTMATGKPWRKAGLMVRAGLDHLDLRLLSMLVPEQDQLQFAARTVYGGPGNIKPAGAVAVTQESVRLAIEREGQSLSVQYSLDGGGTWTTPSSGLGGSVTIADLPATLHIGLMVVSNDISATSTALFDDVAICR